jgi:hypothetical protein
MSCLDKLINAGFLRHALGNDRIDRSESEAMRNPGVDLLADQDGGPILLVQKL